MYIHARGLLCMYICHTQVYFSVLMGGTVALFSVHSIVNVISLIDIMYMNSVNAYVREKMSCFIVYSILTCFNYKE